MKILKKGTAQAEAAKYRQEQIDEGVEIASKIDLLRKTLLDLQKQHAEYVGGMKSVVSKELEELFRQRTTLIAEVNDLRRKLDKLKILPDFEWDKVSEEASYLGTLRTQLETTEAGYVQREAMVSAIEKELQTERATIHRVKSEVISQNEEASEALERIRVLEEATDEKIKEANAYVDERNGELQAREVRILTREKGVDLKVEAINERERKLNDKEKFINDKYQTLVRTELRIKNKNV